MRLRKGNDSSGLAGAGFRLIPLIVFAILFYELCENFSSIKDFFVWLCSALTPLFFGLVIAFIANMPLSFFERRLLKGKKHRPMLRGLLVLFSLLIVLAFFAVSFVLIIPNLVDSITLLASNFDNHVLSLSHYLEARLSSLDLRESLMTYLDGVFNRIVVNLDSLVDQAVEIVVHATVSVAGFILNLLFGFFIAFYLLYNRQTHLRHMRKIVWAFFPARAAKDIISISGQSLTVLHNYVYGVLIDCTVLGTMCFIAMSIFRFPYALLLSVIVGITQIVPYLGPWLSMVFGAVLMLVIDPTLALGFIILVFVVQQIEGYLIYPRIVGRATGVSGLWVLLGVIIGAKVFGIVGAIIGVPLAALGYTLASLWINRRLEKKGRYNRNMIKDLAEYSDDVPDDNYHPE